jgi:hypothetical protein
MSAHATVGKPDSKRFLQTSKKTVAARMYALPHVAAASNQCIRSALAALAALCLMLESTGRSMGHHTSTVALHRPYALAKLSGIMPDSWAVFAIHAPACAAARSHNAVAIACHAVGYVACSMQLQRMNCTRTLQRPPTIQDLTAPGQASTCCCAERCSRSGSLLLFLLLIRRQLLCNLYCV